MPGPQVRLVRRQLRHVAPAVADEPDAERRGNRGGNLVLHRKDIAQLAVVALAPHVGAVGGRNQLGGHADAPAGAPHAAFQHVRDVECPGNPANVLLSAAERERRRARDHPEAGHPRQHVNDLFGQTVAEVLLIPFGAHVGERQDRDGRRRRGGVRSRSDGSQSSRPWRLRATVQPGQPQALEQMVGEAGIEPSAEKLRWRFPELRLLGEQCVERGAGGLAVAELAVGCGTHDARPEEARDAGFHHFVERRTIGLPLVVVQREHDPVPGGMVRVQLHRPSDERTAALPVTHEGNQEHRLVAPVERVQCQGALARAQAGRVVLVKEQRDGERLAGESVGRREIHGPAGSRKRAVERTRPRVEAVAELV